MNWKKHFILLENIINMVTIDLHFYNFEGIITIYTFKLAIIYILQMRKHTYTSELNHRFQGHKVSNKILNA